MVTQITRDGLIQLLGSGAVQLIDVLPEQEFSEFHLPGAVNIPLKDLDGDTVQGLDQSLPTVVY